MATVQNAQGLTGSQVIILNVLSKASIGMTAHEISFAGKGVPVNINTIGPIFEEHLGKYEGSLRSRGLVRAERMEDDDVRWYITDKGMKFASFKGRKVGANKKVPNPILDPALRTFKGKRAYGLEQYTDDDMLELRKSLPSLFHDVELDDLKNQILARRKQGVFKDPEQAKVQSMKKVLKEFGPTGTVIEGFLTEEQVQQLLSRLGNTVDEE